MLGPVSYIDCCVFLFFVAPQLLLSVGITRTLYYGLSALPFLVWLLFSQIFNTRHLLRKHEKDKSFFHDGTFFQRIVLQCMKYALSNLPVEITKVFFTKEVALPFLIFRLWRHGYFRCPYYWKEISRNGVRGLWITCDELSKPDIAIYYCHGGGFCMGSSYFYLEFLLAWLHQLNKAGFKNPAIFALEYSLVPDAVYPTQLHQTARGYRFVLGMAGDPSRVCVSGDSAGATIILSFLLHRAKMPDGRTRPQRPGLAVLISPWVTMASQETLNSSNDYLDIAKLQSYAMQYCGDPTLLDDHIVSPGSCDDLALWRKASPSKGFICTYGSEEVFCCQIREWVVRRVKGAGCKCDEWEEKGHVHAWPVVDLFVNESPSGRVKGLKELSQKIWKTAFYYVDGNI